MLRHSEIKLPLNHSDDELPAAIVRKLKITRDQLTNYRIFKRSYDARNKNKILLIYQLDIELTEQAEKYILETIHTQAHIRAP